MIADKRDELKVAESQEQLAQAAIKAAQAVVREMTQNVAVANADAEYRATWSRFEMLAAKARPSRTWRRRRCRNRGRPRRRSSAPRRRWIGADGGGRGDGEAGDGAGRHQTPAVGSRPGRCRGRQGPGDARLRHAQGTVRRRSRASAGGPRIVVSNSSAGHSDALLTLEAPTSLPSSVISRTTTPPISTTGPK